MKSTTKTGRKLSNGLLVVVSAVCVLVAAEYVLRSYFKDDLRLRADERNLAYRYDERLGWFPKEGTTTSFKGSRRISVAHNRRGFRDIEHQVGDASRILFLGDSFVWGYDVEQSERFTERLRTGFPDWPIYNLGISGYGTDQAFLLLIDQFDFYRPDIVFLLFGTDNDELDNSSNNRYGGYYKPYFEIIDGELMLRGIPVPRSRHYVFASHPQLAGIYLARLAVKVYYQVFGAPQVQVQNPTTQIMLAMDHFTKNRGARLVVGLREQSPRWESILADLGIDYVDMFNALRYPGHGHHWTPQGHEVAADTIAAFLNMGAD